MKTHSFGIGMLVLLAMFGLCLLPGCGTQPGDGSGTGAAALEGEAHPGSVDAELAQLAQSRDSSAEATTTDGRVARYVVLEGPSAIASLNGLDPSSPEGKAALAARVEELKAQHAEVRARLEALGAEIVADVVLVANMIQIRVDPAVLPQIEKIPGVLRLEIPTQVRPHLGQANPLVDVPFVWESGTGLRGEGMRIGIIDTGIDYFHADLGGAGDPADFTADDHDVVETDSFPTARVVGGLDLAGDGYDASGLDGDPTPVPDDDPVDCHGHGTHVAGIAAGGGVLTSGDAYTGTYDSSLDPSGFDIYPGAAPLADLYAIKVFGCDGSTDLILAAFEYAVDPDGDLDISDRLDVVNLSLGSDFTDGTDLEGEAVTNLTTAGCLVVASAGNGGGTTSAHFAAGYPASLPEALSVAATLDSAESSTFLALDVTAPSAVVGIYPLGTTGDAEPNIGTVSELSGEVVVADPVLACDPLTNAAELDGKIAIVERGTCLFVTKSEMAADAGAVAILIVNNVYDDAPHDPFASGGGHAIPMFSVRRTEGLELLDAAPFTATITDGVTTDVVVGPDYVASFSSRGPTADVLRLKPDIGAPGVDIVSAEVGTGASGVGMQGTSMAAPLAAGAAALLRQGRPELGPLAIKELITSTGAPVKNGLDQLFLASLTGTGRISPADALAAEVTARVDGASGETGVSFGAVLAVDEVTESRDIVVTNLGADAVSLAVATAVSIEWPGATVEVDPALIDVPAGGTATVEVSLTVDPAELPESPAYESFTRPVGSPNLDDFPEGDTPSIFVTEVSGRVTFTPTAETDPIAVVAYHGEVRPEAERTVGELTGCLSNAGAGTAALALEGTAAPHGNATSVLELGATDDADVDEANWDLEAVGSLYDPATARVFLGVATAGDWVTPAKGWLSDVGFEIDTDGDEEAEYMVTVESFYQYAFDDYDKSNNSAPYARVVNLTTGELSQSFQPINSIYAAYPGGQFFAGDPSDARETHVYMNSVLVFPVKITDLGLSPTNASFSYRGVSAVSRWQLVVGLPMEEPVDTTDWVEFDVTTPKIALPECFYGTPLCTGDAEEIELTVPAEATALPDLLVLHHSNGPDPAYEIVSLEDASLEGSDLSVTAGAGGAAAVGTPVTATFTVANDAGTDRAGVLVALSITGGTIDGITSAAGSCDSSTCDLGNLASGGSDEITVSATATAAGALTVTAAVTSTSECETATDNDEASVAFDATGGPDGGTSSKGSSGCDCQTVASGSSPGGLLVLLLVIGAAVLLRRRRGRR